MKEIVNKKLICETMGKYKISMIIPTFNVEKDLKRAIDSLLIQTIGFENIEIIIVDDCSTDNTKQLIINYSKKYENIKYIFLNENTGSAGKPRNIGISYATSDYIMFLDNDDEYIAEACEIFFNTITEYDENIVICSKTNRLFSNNDTYQKNIEKPILERINVLKNPNILFSFVDYPGAMWCKIYKRDFLLTHNIKCLENLPEDVYFMHQCYYINPNILFITNINLYNHFFYRTSGKSITVTSSPSFLNKTFIMFDELEKLSKKYDNSELLFDGWSDMYFNEISYQIIRCNANKEEKIELFNNYSERLKKNNLKIISKISLVYNILIKNKMYNLCYIYCELIRLLKL